MSNEEILLNKSCKDMLEALSDLVTRAYNQKLYNSEKYMDFEDILNKMSNIAYDKFGEYIEVINRDIEKL